MPYRTYDTGCTNISYGTAYLIYRYTVFSLIYRVIRNDCRGFNTCHLVLQMQPHVISLYGGYVKDKVYVSPPLPASIRELKVRTRTAIETITADHITYVTLPYRTYDTGCTNISYGTAYLIYRYTVFSLIYRVIRNDCRGF